MGSKLTKIVFLRQQEGGRLPLCALRISEFLQKSPAFEIKVILNVSNLGKGYKRVFFSYPYS